jgi:hypothetical protein
MPAIFDKIRVSRLMNAVAAGTSDQNGTGLDVTDCDGVLFILAVGTLSASQVTNMIVEYSDDDSTYVAVTGASTTAFDDADDNDLAVIDVYRPVHKYLRPVVNRATGNAVIDSVIAIKYNVHSTAVAQHSTAVETDKAVDAA